MSNENSQQYLNERYARQNFATFRTTENNQTYNRPSLVVKIAPKLATRQLPKREMKNSYFEYTSDKSNSYPVATASNKADNSFRLNGLLESVQ